MNKVYIDCGAFKGKTIKQFLHDFNDATNFKVYAFEVNTAFNPRILEHKDSFKEFNLYNEAVWTYAGYIDFFLAGQPVGSTMFSDKITGRVSTTPMSVKCFDFSNWIKHLFTPEDYIILKMNIEGAEYPVLEKMIADQTLHYINLLILELHHLKIPSITQKQHNRLVRKIRQTLDIYLYKRTGQNRKETDILVGGQQCLYHKEPLP
jgi:FkbM family methyltransferase